MNWKEIGQKLLNLLRDGGITLLKCVGVLILGVIIIKLVLLLTKKILEKSKLEKVTQGFIRTTIKFVLNLLLILALVQVIGIPITGFIALLSAAGLAIALSLQDSLSHFANGIVLLSSKPFMEDDYVSIGGIEGTVKSIKMMHTRIVTADNKEICIPNSKVMGSEIINYNKLGTRKVVFTFSVAYNTDVKLVKDVITKVFGANGLIKTDPAPFVGIKNLGESAIDFSASCWCDSADYWTVYYYVEENVFNEFKGAGIEIPFNQLEVRVLQNNVKMPYIDNALPTKRVEKPKKETKKKTNLLSAIEETLGITPKSKEERKAEREAIKKAKQEAKQKEKEERQKAKQESNNK